MCDFQKLGCFLTFAKGSVLIFFFLNSGEYILIRRLRLILSSHLPALENISVFFIQMEFCSVFKFPQDLKPQCSALLLVVENFCITVNRFGDYLFS